MGWKITDPTGQDADWLTKVYATKAEAEAELRLIEADDVRRASDIQVVNP